MSERAGSIRPSSIPAARSGSRPARRARSSREMAAWRRRRRTVRPKDWARLVFMDVRVDIGRAVGHAHGFEELNTAIAVCQGAGFARAPPIPRPQRTRRRWMARGGAPVGVNSPSRPRRGRASCHLSMWPRCRCTGPRKNPSTMVPRRLGRCCFAPRRPAARAPLTAACRPGVNSAVTGNPKDLGPPSSARSGRGGRTAPQRPAHRGKRQDRQFAPWAHPRRKNEAAVHHPSRPGPRHDESRFRSRERRKPAIGHGAASVLGEEAGG
jgi:hypothetical protein